MLKLSNILGRGYFPRELPPPFNTFDFAEFIKSYGRSVPACFVSGNFVSKCASHNLPRSGTLRRTLGIPNPVNFYRLARFIREHWTELCAHTAKSNISLTTPSEGSGERAIDRRHTLQELPKRRAKLRSRSRYVLKADISRFYDTIYTHSIPWALHGKLNAKVDKTSRLIGNELDRLVRDSQDKQTIGIPIGPDTSLLIAEIILSSVDETLKKAGITNGLRYIDDYDFGFQTLAEAEEALCQLQEILNEYELALNPSKTEIITLPWPTDPLTISELRTFRFRKEAVAQYYDILYYFDKALLFAHNNPKDAILRYAVSRLNSIVVHETNWEFCENLLLQCAISEPGTVPFVLNQLLRYRELEYDLHKNHISDVLNSIIEQHAPQGHGGDVAWALWGLLVLDRKLRKNAADLAAKMKDPIVAILLCDADDHDLVPSNTNWDYLASLMTPADLLGEMWLFSYEANMRGWFKSSGKKDHVKSVLHFSELKKARVSFYNKNLSRVIKSEKPEGWALVSSLGIASS
jgi:hypothetical protein